MPRYYYLSRDNKSRMSVVVNSIEKYGKKVIHKSPPSPDFHDKFLFGSKRRGAIYKLLDNYHSSIILLFMGRKWREVDSRSTQGTEISIHLFSSCSINVETEEIRPSSKGRPFNGSWDTRWTKFSSALISRFRFVR